MSTQFHHGEYILWVQCIGSYISHLPTACKYSFELPKSNVYSYQHLLYVCGDFKARCGYL